MSRLGAVFSRFFRHSISPAFWKSDYRAIETKSHGVTSFVVIGFHTENNPPHVHPWRNDSLVCGIFGRYVIPKTQTRATLYLLSCSEKTYSVFRLLSNSTVLRPRGMRRQGRLNPSRSSIRVDNNKCNGLIQEKKWREGEFSWLSGLTSDNGRFKNFRLWLGKFA